MPRREDEREITLRNGLTNPFVKPIIRSNRLSRDEYQRVIKSGEKPELKKCPGCKRKSLHWDTKLLLYICLNTDECGKMYARDQI